MVPVASLLATQYLKGINSWCGKAAAHGTFWAAAEDNFDETITRTLILFVDKLSSVKCLSSSVAEFSSTGGLYAHTKANKQTCLQRSQAIHNASYSCQRSPLISAAAPLSSRNTHRPRRGGGGKTEEEEEASLPPLTLCFRLTLPPSSNCGDHSGSLA